MMRSGKKLLCGLTLLSLGLLVSSCEMDAYEKGEGELSLMTAEMADASVGSDKMVTTVTTDDGERLTLTQAATARWMEKGDTTYRTLFYYNQMSDGRAEAVSFNKVAVLVPFTLAKDDKKDTLLTHPIYMESVWMSQNRKYINMRLRLLTGATNDEKALHTLGIMRDTVNSTATHQRLVVYHDQGGQPEYYSSTVYASVPLNKMTADTLTITANTYGGTFSRTFTLKKD